MNIHFMAGTKVPTPRGHKPSKAGTQPPRTREGQTYPGGKHLRRSLAKLAQRKTGHTNSRFPQRETLPGSMKG